MPATLITWNITNWVTIVLMWLLAYMIVVALFQAAQKYKGMQAAA